MHKKKNSTTKVVVLQLRVMGAVSSAVKQRETFESLLTGIVPVDAQFNPQFGKDNTMLVGTLLLLIFLALIAPGLLRGLFYLAAWVIGMTVLFMWVGSL